MLLKKSVDEMLMKARSHVNNGNILEAQRLYQDIFQAKKELMKLEFKALNKSFHSKTVRNLHKEEINKLLNLYKEGQFNAVVKKAKVLTLEYPQEFIIWNLMGASATEIGMLDQAIIAYKKAISLKPDYAEVYCNMGIALQKQNKLDEAIQAYNKAISYDSEYVDAHRNLSFALLNSGRLKEGFDEYEWRWKTPVYLLNKRKFPQRLWNEKECLSGKKILLWCEQGIADTIMWSSCLPLIASQAKQCILECQPKLVPLLKRSFPDVKIKAENRSLDSQRDDFDFHLPMGSLYKNFIEEISKVDNRKSYLVPDPDRVRFWKKRLKSTGKGPYIGISWKSANLSSRRQPNFADISELSPVLTLPGLTFINLQYTDFINDLEKVQNQHGVKIHNFDDLDHFNNIDDVAALCSALDIVVSTQSVIASISAGTGTLTKLANWKPSSNNNILYKPVGPLVEKYEREALEPWENVFQLIANDITDYYKLSQI